MSRASMRPSWLPSAEFVEKTAIVATFEVATPQSSRIRQV